VAGFWFNEIHILQSLPIGERTGPALRTSILLSIPDAATRVHLSDLVDKQALRSKLVALAANLEDHGIIPVLHFECHGSEDGLHLASSELVTWDELRDLLTPLNIACGLNLFVSLAACHGDRLATAIRLTEPAPVWGLLGPRTVEKSGFLSTFFCTFFVHLLKYNDPRAALVAAGGGTHLEDKPLVLWTAVYFFVLAFRGWQLQYGTEARIAASAERLATRVQQQKGLPDEARIDLARDYSRTLSDHESHFARFVRIYLMLGLFPDNEARFGLTWARFQTLFGSAQSGA
jgi:hypothetical protein